jgi:transposase
MEQQQQYVGLDVSLETIAVCVINDDGGVVRRGKCASTPESITDTIRRYTPAAIRVGLETGQLSNWLTLKEVAVKSIDAHTLKMLLVARAQLVSQRQKTANRVRGLHKTFGLIIARGSKGQFSVRVREQIAGNNILAAIIEPLPVVWHATREQIATLDRQTLARAHRCRRAAPHDHPRSRGRACLYRRHRWPGRFHRSASAGAYLGLTPWRYQSGEVDTTGYISKCGDGLLRAYLFEAAMVLLARHRRTSTLKTWGLALAERVGQRRAKVAAARKLALVMHRVWSDRGEYRWGDVPAAA